MKRINNLIPFILLECIMTLRKIEIDESLYKELLKRKREDETISDVITRILHIQKGPQDIRRFFGLWKDLPEEYFNILEADRNEIREEINKRFTFQ